MQTYRRTWGVVLMIAVMAWVGGGTPPAWAQPAHVPQTGQTQCWDTAGTLISCTRTGQDGDLQAGVDWPTPRFQDRRNGTVRDNLTGLIWLKDMSCIVRTWAAAFAAIADLNVGVNFGCVEYVPGTFADWRLPNVKELQSLIDLAFWSPTLSNAAGTAQWAEGNAFVRVQSNDCWSSTTWLPSPDFAYVVTLHDGRTNAGNKTAGAYVWPVRGGD